MSLESPPRLKHGAELGPILRAADTPVTVERIASNQAAVKAAIAAGLVRGSLPLWLKLGVALLFVVGGVAVFAVVTRDEEVPPPPATMPVIVAVAPIDAAPVIVIDAEAVPDAVEIIQPPPRVPPKPVAKPKPRVPLVEAAPPLPPAPPAPSDLPAQIKLYEDARAEAARGQIARGIALLDELLQKWPATALRAEAELTRAELLTRANRLGDAAVALEALAASPVHRGRRGELLRALGDVRRKQGDCPRAIEAYTLARGTRLDASEITKVERGLERCAKPR